MATLHENLKALEFKLGDSLTVPEYLFITDVFDVTEPDIHHQCRDALNFFRKGYESGWDDARMTFEDE